jgi:TDG/mug DNA glycosylase family protein
VYQAYSGRKKVNWGLQEVPVIAGVSEFVAPSSSGLVRMKFHEVVEIYQQLVQLKMEK